ncbi:putative TonB-dependent receptor [Caenibius tardaugens NBRC 16725]|uniref:Putative TonB-dependent receptor n=1 Tax=Caenibius tardaugens NBRC 16725 TaxID=1219035 RepID=U3A3F7_9SPHN|nr:TonB-dependent receptor [Caenibius tardaugens]GAD49283.1 putative TonB-dependent receptor [Caenibius tardaugens NBRC 16725]
MGWDGLLPVQRTPPLHGQMTANEALDRLLAGTGLVARKTGPHTYRIRRFSTPRAARAPTLQVHVSKRVEPVPSATGTEIVVTGQKRLQNLARVPMSISVVDLDDIRFFNAAADTRLIARSVDGLALTNLGPGQNRQFIRGVADSPFDGPSQSTVAVQLDNTRLTFDAPDPDLRLVDVDQVEVLKGPQGPLYGSGALGGIYHIVTHKPDLATVSGHMRMTGQAVQHGQITAGGDAVINLPLVNDTLALRAVGYVDHRAGWIDNIGRTADANSAATFGGRLALRWQPDSAWSIDISGILQNVDVADSQYVNTSHESIKREGRIPEPSDSDFKAMAATVQRRMGSVNLLATTSYVTQKISYKLDSSNASPLFGLSGPSRFTDDNRYSLWNTEIRVSPSGNGRWITGLSYMEANTRSHAAIATLADSVVAESMNRKVTEIAVFGEFEIPLSRQFSLTGGARLFQTKEENEAAETIARTTEKIRKTGFSPSASLAWHPTDRNLLYLRYARALRPGGLAPGANDTARRFESDELGTFDLGYRHENRSKTLQLAASAFITTWNDIQSDYLLPNGLVSTRNAGQGRIHGVELSATWQPVEGLKLGGGITYLDAMLVKTQGGAKLDDRRLPVVPKLSGRFEAQYRFTMGTWRALIAGQASYTGHARLSFDENLDRSMGGYAILTTSAALSRDHLTLGLNIDNALNVRGDSFAFGNPFSIMSGRQYTPVQPRTMTLSITRAW